MLIRLLGHVITNQLNDTADILQRRNDIIRHANNVLGFFSKVNLNIKCKCFFVKPYELIWM